MAAVDKDIAANGRRRRITTTQEFRPNGQSEVLRANREVPGRVAAPLEGVGAATELSGTGEVLTNRNTQP